MAHRYPFVQLDVFSDRPLTGNPLAVFLDGRGLTDSQMHGLAREMNLSETAFVIPRDPAIERERGVRVRIFTVDEEIPFAGHPTLGTAFALRADTGIGEVALELGVGRVPVRFEQPGEMPALGEMTQIDPTMGPVYPPADVAAALGIDAEGLDPDLPIRLVSTGLPYLIVPFRSLEALARLELDVRRAEKWLKAQGGRHFYLVTRQTEDPRARLHARMIFSGGEDPATGSAAGCAAAWMVAYGVAQPDERAVIEQGLEAKRPSRIFVRASREGERVHQVRVGGSAVEVLRGEARL